MPTGTMKPGPEKAETWVAVNGRIVPEAEACLTPSDRGFLYGDGLFETMKARHGRVDFLEKHLDRMREGARDLAIPFSPAPSFPALIQQLLDWNGLHETASVKICLSRGTHKGPLSLYESAEPTLVIFARAWEEPDPDRWERGLEITVEKEIRQNRFSGICHLKTLNYLPYLLTRTRAGHAGFEEAILLNGEGSLCECTAANIFFFRQGQLETPAASCGLLPGITRAVLLEILDGNGTPAREVTRPAEILAACEEIFVTNSLLEIMPVGRVDGHHFPRREQTRELRDRFRSFRNTLYSDA